MNSNKQGLKIVHIENGRVKKAYDFVKEIMDKDDEIKKEYKSYVKKIPSMILTNGIGPTIAFMYSKKGTYEIIYNQIQDYLKSDISLRFRLSKDTGLIEAITTLDSINYKLLTAEIMALFNWLRKFAEGMLEVDDNAKETEDRNDK